MPRSLKWLTPGARKDAWIRMLSKIIVMMYQTMIAIKALSSLSALPLVRARLVANTSLHELLRTAPETLLQIKEEQDGTEDVTAKCSHVYEDGRSALKQHGGPVTTAACQKVGCQHRLIKMKTSDGKTAWVPWPRGEPRPNTASSSSSRSQASSALPPGSRPQPRPKMRSVPHFHLGEDEAMPQVVPTGRDPYSTSEIPEESEDDEFAILSEASDL